MVEVLKVLCFILISPGKNEQALSDTMYRYQDFISPISEGISGVILPITSFKLISQTDRGKISPGDRRL